MSLQEGNQHGEAFDLLNEVGIFKDKLMLGWGSAFLQNLGLADVCEVVAKLLFTGLSTEKLGDLQFPSRASIKAQTALTVLIFRI